MDEIIPVSLKEFLSWKNDNSYEGKIDYIRIYTIPDKDEVLFLRHIEEHKKIQNGTSNRRPDLLLELDHQILIIEIDENQHKDYDCSCENKRLMQISQDLDHRSIVFIRFNPDDYINSKGIKIKSSWILNKKGLLVIPDENKNNWNTRLQSLNNQIKYTQR